MNDFWNRLREGLARLPARQKVQIAIALVATVGAVWGLSVYATRIRYGVLYSNLAREDAAAVVSALAERQVPYRLGAGGSIIEVPSSRVDEMRLELAAEGLPPGGGVGFEIFDRPAFGLSDFVQNVNYRRALERELARTIQSLDAVHSARVHLALPPESVFADETREPSASVVVRLKSGEALSTGRVRAIAHLVASGVEGLRADNVSVIDGDGHMLTDGQETDSAMSASQLASKQAMERAIEATLVSILEPIVGGGKVRARATVELDQTRVERTSETYDPDVAVVRSEQKSKTKQGSGGAGGGIPGTASNLPGEEGGDVLAATTAGSESQTSRTNFELNRTVSTVAEPAGRLARQSVAVVVDHAAAVDPAATADGGAAPERQPRSEEEMRQITDIVRAAAGIDESRGDVLIVENVAFNDVTDPLGESGGGFDWGFLVTLVRYASLPLGILLLALLVIRPGIAALRGLRVPADAEGPITVAALQARLREELPALAGEASPLRRRLIEAASEDPRAAALAIRSWLGKGGERP
jgi:flagellar M-ring protein FliF